MRVHVALLLVYVAGIVGLLICAGPSHAAVVYVRLDSGDDGPGSDWDHAYHTITGGLNAAAPGDEVWAAKGTYLERITLKSGVALYGGFSGNEITRDQRNWKTSVTVLDGNKGGTVVTCPASAVAGTVVDGFTIRNGRNSLTGGGVICSSGSYPIISNNVITGNAGSGIQCSSCSPTISNNIISGNVVEENPGGGIWCSGGSPTITGNTITGNSAWGGGGIYCGTSSPVISNNVISGNLSHGSGGGISCSGNPSRPPYPFPPPPPLRAVISNNVITGNSAWGGGGIYCAGLSATISGNTITGNGAYTNGGGIYFFTDAKSAQSVHNNIVAFNSSGIYEVNASIHILENNCVYNPDGANYSGLAPGSGDISVDPKVDAVEYGQVHIQSDSPCVDAGDDSAVAAGRPDIDGQDRVQGAHVDIGADESDGTEWDYAPVVVRVKPEGDDSADGSNWDKAKKTIQAGVDAASSLGGEVWVAKGTYAESVVLRAYAFLYGGFAGLESVRSARDYKSNITKITGNWSSAVETRTGHSVTRSGIDGFTISCSGGSGVNCASSPVIANNIFTGSDFYGINCYYSSATICNNIITANRSSGIWCNNASPTVFNNIISINGQGGIYCYRASSPIITNNTIVANTHGTGGIYCDSNSAPRIKNNIVAFNESGIKSSGNPVLTNNCVYNPNTTNFTGLTAGAGDISTDPQLVAVEYGQFHIRLGSPCVDAGDGSAVGTGWLDMDGQARVQGTHVDIGADESDGTKWDYAPIVVRVKPDGSDAADGSSWDKAKKTIQAGVDVASSQGGEVWVAKGTYVENVFMPPYAYLYGGFAGTETEQNARDRKANVTIIDGGGGTGNVVTMRTGYSITRSGIDGLTIRNGEGAGISGEHSSPVIENNNVTANAGGGIGFSYSSAIIRGNAVTDNHLGGIGAGGSPTIMDNWVTGNGATGVTVSGSGKVIHNVILNNGGVYGHMGSGVLCGSGSPTVSGNIIARNSDYNGGGIYVGQSSPTICNNTIVGNKATYGAAIFFSNSGASTISNNIIAFNTGGIYDQSNSTAPVLRNNCVFNPGGINYTGLSAGTGDFSADPLFTSLVSGNYHLTSASPCINAGWNDAPGIPLQDFDGQKRIQGTTVDIGADEWWPGAGDAKKIASGSIGFSAIAVSAAFSDFFYVESDDRSAGIRVDKPGHTIEAGMRVDVEGTPGINGDGEAVITAGPVTPNGMGRVTPVAVTNKSLGGGQFGFQEALWGWVPVKQSDDTVKPEWLPSVGISNVGLLARTWGRVTYAGNSFFYIDDGSGLDDNSGHKGVKVYGSVPVDQGVDPVGKRVFVTGISSCEKPGNDPVRVIRTRGTQDVSLAGL